MLDPAKLGVHSWIPDSAAPLPTCYKSNGSSRVDLCFHISKVSPVVSVQELTDLSDHAPLTARLSVKCKDNDLQIPLAVLKITNIRECIITGYKKELPRCIQILKQCPDLGTSQNCHQETGVCNDRSLTDKPGRFREGWTWKLDKLGKRRSVLQSVQKHYCTCCDYDKCHDPKS